MFKGCLIFATPTDNPLIVRTRACRRSARFSVHCSNWLSAVSTSVASVVPAGNGCPAFNRRTTKTFASRLEAGIATRIVATRTVFSVTGLASPCDASVTTRAEAGGVAVRDETRGVVTGADDVAARDEGAAGGRGEVVTEGIARGAGMDAGAGRGEGMRAGTGGGDETRWETGAGADGGRAGAWGAGVRGAGAIVLVKSAAARASTRTRASLPSFSAWSAARRSQRTASAMSPCASRARAVSSASTRSSESESSIGGVSETRLNVSLLICATIHHVPF